MDPSFSPLVAPISPVFSSAATFSPEVQVGGQNQHMDQNRKLLIALIAASTALGAIIFFIICFWIYHRKSYSNQSSDDLKGIALGPVVCKFNSFKSKTSRKPSVSIMKYKTLESATNNFQQSEILGEGGFGCVYKGKLEDDLCVAVKKLQGGTPDAIKEFETEVELLSQIQHPNIISLLGYCVHDETRLIVYELMPNGSLETQIHGPSHGSALTWYHRMKIALDAARGLEYLHEHCNPPVIHRDMKSSNILLDSNFNAKLSDFGLAVLGGAQNKNNIKLSGTLGYVAPEYLLDGIDEYK